MFTRRMVRTALAALLTGLGCALARAQSPDASRGASAARAAASNPTGIFRLLSASQPVPNPQLEADASGPLLTSDPLAPDLGVLGPSGLGSAIQGPGAGAPGTLNLAAPGGATTIDAPCITDPAQAAPLEWHNPYEFGPPAARERPHWKRWMPLGMDPWGPRTPLAARSTGFGKPLVTTSWLNRPYSAGWFAGGVNGPPIISGVNQRGGFFGGYRVGWDYDFYWGVEARIAGSELCLAEPDIGRQGITAGYFLFDASLLYYPWGDSVWRPYASLGLGLANIGFFDNQDHHYNQTLFGVPIGIGMKYYWTPWFIFRGDLTDNLAFGGGLPPLTNVSLTGGVEIRFGGVRRSYWPWNTGRTIR